MVPSRLISPRRSGQWQTRGHGALCRYADDLVAMCKTRREAEAALGALTAILARRMVPGST
jgi:hypothetical protein